MGHRWHGGGRAGLAGEPGAAYRCARTLAWLARKPPATMQPVTMLLPPAGPTWQRRLAWLLLSAPLAACSATSAVRHSPAQFTAIESSRVVAASENLVLRRLIGRLPAAGLTVVEIDDAAIAVVVALTTDQPDGYVDCGRTQRTFEGGWGGVETFDYEPASGASYKLTSYDGVALHATRNVVLDATATVWLQPAAATTQPAMTEVRVEVSYDLETQVTYNENGPFAFASGDAEPVTRAIRFETDRPGIGDGEVALCMSNGRLEVQLLDLAT